jgi:hypothetical protein
MPVQSGRELYRKTPEQVRELMRESSKMSAPAGNSVFKRWALLAAEGLPEVVRGLEITNLPF